MKYFKESSRRWYFKDYLTSEDDSEDLAYSTDEEDSEDDDDLDATNNDDASAEEEEVNKETEVEANKKEEEEASAAAEDTQPKPTYRSTIHPQPPVRVNIRKRVTSWTLDLRGRKSSLFSIILGLSAGTANIDQIESIEFKICSLNDGWNEDFHNPSEFFNKQDVKELFRRTGLARWKLHNQFKKEDYLKLITVEMEVRTSQDDNEDDSDNDSQVDPGYFDLHYMELVKEPIGTGSPIAHECTGLIDELSEDLSPTMKIVTYAISGDGSHVATLAGYKEHVYLDVWDLRNPQKPHSDYCNSNSSSIFNPSSTNVDKIDERSISSNPSKDPPVILPGTTPTSPVITPFAPRCSARVSAIELPGSCDSRQVGVSLSWDASMVALLDASTIETYYDTLPQSAFAIYDHTCGPHSTTNGKGDGVLFAATVLKPSERHLDFAATPAGRRLDKFFGYGKFHITALENKNVKDELFVTCDEKEVNVFGIYPKWRHIHTVRLDQPQDILTRVHLPCRRLISTLRGRSFAWDVRNDDGIMVYDIMDGSIISFNLKHRLHPKDTSFLDILPFCLSNDGSVLALYQERVISTHWVGSGTLRGKFLLPERYKIPDDIQFIRGDTHLLIRVKTKNEDLGRSLLGLIVRVADMALVDCFALPGDYLALPATSAVAPTGGVMDQDLLTAHQSTLDLIRLEDRIPNSWSSPKFVCDDSCRAKLSRFMQDDKVEVVSPSGIRFNIESCVETVVKLASEVESTSVVITASFENGEPIEKLVIPQLGRPMWRGTYWLKFFLKCGTRLVIASSEMFMLWSLPTSLEGSVKLLVAMYTADGNWHCCPHQQLFSAQMNMMRDHDGSCMWLEAPRAEAPLTRESVSQVLIAIPYLAELYQQGDETFRREILRFVGMHINTHPVPEEPNKSILPSIAEIYDQENYQTLQVFVADLLESPYGRWVPKQGFDNQSNPIEILLHKSKTQPQAITMVETLINYCIRQARAEDDAHFLVPVMSCLPLLIEPGHPHQELAQRTLRRLAYIPVKSRSLILDHHQISYPFTFRWKFWVRSARPLYRCKNPVVQMTREQLIDPINGNFAADLYVTSDDLLWSLKKEMMATTTTITDSEEELTITRRIQQPLVKAVRPNGVMTWIKVIAWMIWYKCKLWSSSSIEVHSFSPQALNHPAILAIVEYKWNKIGYKYWLMRFIFQCLYYILVLVTVFLQVYDDQGNSMAGLFVAIAAFSVVFLWLELIQMIRDQKGYLSSIYNFVDLAVFGLPLAGSINQLCIIWANTSPGGNPALLSFSVLFIFLHFLFELRVHKSVCHFVTIIIQIFNKIKIFFFIFAGGVLAFSIAILHLLQSCKGDNCPESDFPSNFLRAMSATYFFMGGIYDPISPLFNSDRVAFHLMMVVFFFFTVILMLNVLISLISLAFSDGDETWRLTWIENRLRYVESAENMSYHIPGYREEHTWFPKEIYYSATPQQVRDYNKVSEELNEHKSIVTIKETSPSSVALLGLGASDDPMHFHSHSHSLTHADTKASLTGGADEVGGVAGKGVAVVEGATSSEVVQLKTQLQESQAEMLLLLQQLAKQQEQNVAQQTQLRDQQQLLATQLGELQGHILTLLKK
ncbi:hypothetical protein EC991_005692 [Linnemannia zychae]|nr:hypothetical protein EC991_005692 [Linnemannia zychae]